MNLHHTLALPVSIICLFLGLGHPPGYPIPEEAKTNSMIEGGVPGGGTSGDRHLILVDQDNRLLYETWATHWTGSNWSAGSGAVFELDTNNRRPEGWTSADAAGLAILPGLVRAEEVFVESNVSHAIRATVHGVNGYVFPASHNANTDPNSPIPLGTRLRLTSDVDTRRDMRERIFIRQTSRNAVDAVHTATRQSGMI